MITRTIRFKLGQAIQGTATYFPLKFFGFCIRILGDRFGQFPFFPARTLQFVRPQGGLGSQKPYGSYLGSNKNDPSRPGLP